MHLSGFICITHFLKQLDCTSSAIFSCARDCHGPRVQTRLTVSTHCRPRKRRRRGQRRAPHAHPQCSSSPPPPTMAARELCLGLSSTSVAGPRPLEPCRCSCSRAWPSAAVTRAPKPVHVGALPKHLPDAGSHDPRLLMPHHRSRLSCLRARPHAVAARARKPSRLTWPCGSSAPPCSAMSRLSRVCLLLHATPPHSLISAHNSHCLGLAWHCRRRVVK